jgi:uncharacterized membrane protein YesL
MSNNKQFFNEKTIFTFMNYIYWFLLGNAYFFLLNFPIVFIILAVYQNGNRPIPPWFSIISAICCIPIGPAAAALFSVMGKLIREKQINITSDFFKAYKSSFFQATFLCTLEILAISILQTDLTFMINKKFPSIILILVYAIIIIIFAIGLFIFPILSRFYLKSTDIVKLSMHYVIKNPHIAIFNLVNFVFVGFILFKISAIILLFITSIICYLTMYYEQKILAEIEEDLKPEET